MISFHSFQSKRSNEAKTRSQATPSNESNALNKKLKCLLLNEDCWGDRRKLSLIHI